LIYSNHYIELPNENGNLINYVFDICTNDNANKCIFKCNIDCQSSIMMIFNLLLESKKSYIQKYIKKIKMIHVMHNIVILVMVKE